MPIAEIPAAPVLALMGLGVLIAIAGHATRLRGLVALGLTILFVATAAMIVGGFMAYNGDERDPRPSRPASEPTL